MLAAPEIPGVNGIDGCCAEQALDFSETFSCELQRQEFSAALTQSRNRPNQPLARLTLFDRTQRIGAIVRKLKLIHRHLRILPSSLRFSPRRHHFESDDLQRKRKKIFQPVEVAILFMQQEQHFLRQVLGSVPLHSGCRKADDPFAQFREELFASAWSRLLDATGKHRPKDTAGRRLVTT